MKLNMCSTPSNHSHTLRIAITGGIGSGKSYVCRHIEEAGYPVFYCDDEAKRIIRTHPGVRQALTRLVGEGLYDTEGKLVKTRLAAFLCAGRGQAERVDAIVHPEVARAFNQWAERQSTDRVFMECALLFEAGFERLVDRVAVVTVPEDLRLRRVMQRDNITEETARKWMALQLPEEEKAQRADFIVHNDGKHDLNAELAPLIHE